jgi:FkbM family methyltransferase
MPEQRLLVTSSRALGDIVVLTAAVRELHRAYPGRFLTDVQTSCTELWDHNPNVTRSAFMGRRINCHKIVGDKTGRTGKHYAHAYIDLLNRELNLDIQPRKIQGDIHLSEVEKRWHSDLWTFCKREIPFWIISGGGKFDMPIKWWDHARYQKVVDAFRGRIQFVQIGRWTDHHPMLDGVIDLRGKTDIRDLIHLVYYSQGVLCGVTSLMHLAAAVPTEVGSERAAVIVAGAREPATWEKYPGHHFLETTSSVPCAHCWRSRHTPIPDGARINWQRHRCQDVQNDLPRCMDLITPEHVIHAIERCFTSGRRRYLSPRDYAAAHIAVQKAEQQNDFERHNVNLLNSAEKIAEFIPQIPPYPPARFNGRGIVICGGGVTYFTNAWVCIRRLRDLGCSLPIELWYLGREELDTRMESLLKPLDVRCINALLKRREFPLRNALGWELKSYALLHSNFKEVLLLDSDNVCTRNPEYLFQSPEYLQHGAIFWPDYGRLGPRRPIWKLTGVPYRDEPEFESGQILVHKQKCWCELNLAFWLNDHSELFYRYIHGDKDTFHLAWRRLNRSYAMPPFPIKTLRGTMCQHDFGGQVLFQHRNLLKWDFFQDNPRVPGFEGEEACLQYVEELRTLWDGQIRTRPQYLDRYGFRFRDRTMDEGIFLSVTRYNEYKLPRSLSPDDVVIDVGAHIGSFSLAATMRGSQRVFAFEPNPANFRLARHNLAPHPGVQLLRKAVLGTSGRVTPISFPTQGQLQNTGGSGVTLDPEGKVPSTTLDEILLQHPRVAILKLDCEGAEWGLLLKSKELRRVQFICGEYHARQSDPFCPETPGPFDALLLTTLLKSSFKSVQVCPDPQHPSLGKFWARNPKHGGPATTNGVRASAPGIQPA